MKASVKWWSGVIAPAVATLIAAPAGAQVSMESWHVNTFNVGATKDILVAMGGTAKSNGVVRAVLTDPWGARILLTEGGAS